MFFNIFAADNGLFFSITTLVYVSSNKHYHSQPQQ